MMRSECLVSIALFAPLMHAQTTAPQDASNPPEMCTLEGRVVGALKGEPVRKATLILSREPQGQRYSTESNSGGLFAMQDIEPGKYRLMVVKSGYAPTQYGARNPRHPGITLSLDPGQRVHDLILRLTPQAVITGRVLDEDGDPLPQISIQLFQYGYLRGKRRQHSLGYAMTNDLGEYRLFDLPPGRYRLCAYPENEMEGQERSARGRSYVATYYPGTADPSDATFLDLRPGTQLRGIDIPLMKGRTARLRGRVILPAKTAAAPQINVMLVTNDRSRFSSPAAPNLDSEGIFEFRGVAPGGYSLVAEWSQDGKSYSARQAIDVRESDLENLVLELSPVPELDGHVHVEGRPPQRLADLQIWLEAEGDVYTRWASGPVHKDGSFTINNVVAGQYELRVQGLSEDFYVKSARLGDKDILDSGIDASRGAAGSLEISISSLGGQIEGIVLNSEEQPVTGAAVVLVPDTSRRRQSRLYKEVTTDQYGRFHILSIAAGDYKLFAWDDVETGAYEDPEFLKSFEELGESLTIREGSRESKQLKLIPSEAKEGVN
jgi:carboxypeptidase family protein